MDAEEFIRRMNLEKAVTDSLHDFNRISGGLKLFFDSLESRFPEPHDVLDGEIIDITMGLIDAVEGLIAKVKGRI